MSSLATSFDQAYRERREQLVHMTQVELPKAQARLAELKLLLGDHNADDDETASLRRRIDELKQDKPIVEYVMSILPLIRTYGRANGGSDCDTTTTVGGHPMHTDRSVRRAGMKTRGPSVLVSSTVNARKQRQLLSGGNLHIEATQVVDVEKVLKKGTVFAEYLLNASAATASSSSLSSSSSAAVGVTVSAAKDAASGEAVSRYTDLMAVCEYCGCDRLIIFDRDATRVCAECGNSEVYQREDSEQLTFREESEQVTLCPQFAYKRVNHFCDWLNAFETGLHGTSGVPDGVLQQLRYELKKLRVQDLSTITPTLTRQLLKKSGLTKYYEYTNAISAELSGRTPLAFDPLIKQKLRIMFEQLQTPFEIFKPPDRKNFLSYSYVIYKCLQLLGQDSFLQYFTLLKSRDKLKLQDSIWRKICQYLKWEYICSI